MSDITANNLKARVLFPCILNGRLPGDLQEAYDEALITLQSKAWVHYSILINTQVHWTCKIPTAGTDGVHVYINPEFFARLPTIGQRAFLLGHEVGHIVLRHPQRSKFYRLRGFHSMQGSQRIEWDARQFNIDADKVINADLIAHGLELIPQGMLDDAVSRDDLVDEVYVQSMLGRAQKDEQCDDAGDAGATDEPGAGDADDQSDDEPQGSGHGGHDDHFEPEYDGTAEEQAEAEADDRGEIERRIDEALDALDNDAVDTGSNQVSPTGATLNGSYRHRLERDASSTDWRAELAEVVTKSGGDGEDDWSRINRRRYVTVGTIAPSHKGTLDQMAFTVDISSSVSRRGLTNAMTELASLIDALEPTSGCIVLWTNTSVTHVDEVFSGQELLDLQVPSGGGTRMAVACDWLDENGYVPDVHLCFTDGHLRSSDWQRLADSDTIVVLDRHPDSWTRREAEQAGVKYIVASDVELAA